MVRVKICGITSVEDALFAEEAGADAIGVVLFSDSPRNVTLQRANEIFSSLGPFITRVAVTHTTDAREIGSILSLHPSALQVYHDLDRGCAGVKCIRMVGRGEVWKGQYDAIGIDESRGRGRLYDPAFAREVARVANLPVILSGGLSPENVRESIATLHPYAVDVCSGVEERPGVKDHGAVRRFIDIVRSQQF